MTLKKIPESCLVFKFFFSSCTVLYITDLFLRNLCRNPAYHVGGDDDVRGCDGGQA